MVFVQGLSIQAQEIEENQFDTSYVTYQSLIENGILDENEFPYETWKEIVEQSEKDYERLLNDELIGPRATYKMQLGDIYISNATSSSGLTGHAGIAINPDQILHIAGPGKNPTVVSLATWKKTYAPSGKWTKVYRNTNDIAAAKASTWVYNNYRGKGATYSLLSGLGRTDIYKTYCSKIVFQGYYWGAGSSYATYPLSDFITPYGIVK